MYCKNCGTQIPDGTQYCSNCGYDNGMIVPPNLVKVPGKDLGLASMILGFVALGTQLLGIFAGVSMPAAIAALICGFIGKKQAADAGLENSNARTGIICGFVEIGISILTTILAVILVVLIFVFYYFIIFAILGSAASGMYYYY